MDEVNSFGTKRLKNGALVQLILITERFAYEHDLKYLAKNLFRIFEIDAKVRKDIPSNDELQIRRFAFLLQSIRGFYEGLPEDKLTDYLDFAETAMKEAALGMIDLLKE